MLINTSIIDLTDVTSNLGLYRDCLRLRRDVFISHMGWNLYESLGCEFDQYDTPASIHLTATVGTTLVGCMRLLRTDSDHSGITYMILDAHRGQIPNLPSGILEAELVSSTAWEASRLAISTKIERDQRNDILFALVNAGRAYIQSRGGDTMLGMMNPVFRRVFNRAGFDVRQFGPTLNQRDGRICILRWDFSTPCKEEKMSECAEGL